MRVFASIIGILAISAILFSECQLVGIYNTTFGVMDMGQDGSDVYGTWDKGKVDGTLTGDFLELHFSKESEMPGSHYEGSIVAIVSGNCVDFYGNYSYEGDTYWHAMFYGKRDIPSVDIAERGQGEGDDIGVPSTYIEEGAGSELKDNEKGDVPDIHELPPSSPMGCPLMLVMMGLMAVGFLAKN